MRHRLVGKYIVHCINQKKQQDFDELNGAYKEALELQKQAYANSNKCRNSTKNRRLSKFIMQTMEDKDMVDIDDIINQQVKYSGEKPLENSKK